MLLDLGPLAVRLGADLWLGHWDQAESRYRFAGIVFQPYVRGNMSDLKLAASMVIFLRTVWEGLLRVLCYLVQL